VFRLRAADIYRVIDIEALFPGTVVPEYQSRPGPVDLSAVGEVVARLSRCGDLDSQLQTGLQGLHELLGYRHSALLLLDETGDRLYTIASHGFDTEGVGSEVTVGDGVIGAAAQRCEAVQVGHLRQMRKYAETVRQAFEAQGQPGAEREIPVPHLPDVQSQLAVPAMARGELVGVLAVESPVPAAFDPEDEAVLGTIAALLAGMVTLDRAADEPEPGAPAGAEEPGSDGPPVSARFFPADGSVFLDNEYVIRGVAGRILWSLLGQHAATGRVDFTTKELRLDPSLELPQFRDNLDTRLILLKRRLDEREAPIRITRTGRGRIRLLVHSTLQLESAQ
jgi:adenylate cyclase